MKTNPIFICLYGHVILNHPIDLKEVCLDILSIEVRNGFSCLGQKKQMHEDCTWFPKDAVSSPVLHQCSDKTVLHKLCKSWV